MGMVTVLGAVSPSAHARETVVAGVILPGGGGLVGGLHGDAHRPVTPAHPLHGDGDGGVQLLHVIRRGGKLERAEGLIGEAEEEAAGVGAGGDADAGIFPLDGAVVEAAGGAERIVGHHGEGEEIHGLGGGGAELFEPEGIAGGVEGGEEGVVRAIVARGGERAGGDAAIDRAAEDGVAVGVHGQRGGREAEAGGAVELPGPLLGEGAAGELIFEEEARTGRVPGQGLAGEGEGAAGRSSTIDLAAAPEGEGVGGGGRKGSRPGGEEGAGGVVGGDEEVFAGEAEGGGSIAGLEDGVALDFAGDEDFVGGVHGDVASEGIAIGGVGAGGPGALAADPEGVAIGVELGEEAGVVEAGGGLDGYVADGEDAGGVAGDIDVAKAVGGDAAGVVKGTGGEGFGPKHISAGGEFGEEEAGVGAAAAELVQHAVRAVEAEDLLEVAVNVNGGAIAGVGDGVDLHMGARAAVGVAADGEDDGPGGIVGGEVASAGAGGIGGGGHGEHGAAHGDGAAIEDAGQVDAPARRRSDAPHRGAERGDALGPRREDVGDGGGGGGGEGEGEEERGEGEERGGFHGWWVFMAKTAGDFINK